MVSSLPQQYTFLLICNESRMDQWGEDSPRWSKIYQGDQGGYREDAQTIPPIRLDSGILCHPQPNRLQWIARPQQWCLWEQHCQPNTNNLVDWIQRRPWVRYFSWNRLDDRFTKISTPLYFISFKYWLQCLVTRASHSITPHLQTHSRQQRMQQTGTDALSISTKVVPP